MSDLLLSTYQVSALLNVGPRTVQVWAERGLIEPAFRIHGRLKFTTSEVERFIKSEGHVNKKKNSYEHKGTISKN